MTGSLTLSRTVHFRIARSFRKPDFPGVTNCLFDSIGAEVPEWPKGPGKPGGCLER